VLIFGISGACKSSELTRLTMNDVLNRGDIMVIKVRDSETKNTRNFTVEGELLRKVLEYQSLRPKHPNTDRFLLSFRNGKCANQVIGKNKVGRMPREIAQFLKLPNPELYTGHSFRRTSVTRGAEEGYALDTRTTRWLENFESITVSEDFVDDSESLKRKNDQQQICPSIANASINSFESPSAKRQKTSENNGEEKEEDAVASSSKIFIGEDFSQTSFNLQKQNVTLQFTNCTNITINFAD